MMSPFLDPEERASRPQVHYPHGWWILPGAVLGLLFFIACLITLYSQAAYSWLQGLGLK